MNLHHEIPPARRLGWSAPWNRRWVEGVCRVLVLVLGIAVGAVHGNHWAFITPATNPPPEVRNAAWPRTPVDRFILASLEARALTPSPEADRETLLRRVFLDLTGMPPTPAEVDAWVADWSDDAYERQVDRLLASPRYGERMTQDWLDAARYADTNGYQVDRDRELWAWREWVIRAFNRNLPFDQFTVEQLAGDLLPAPTMDQRIATGFHRNHMINEEGGIIPEEFLAEYCADRVETTATVWLGLTMNCARCHDHKYDPVTQHDYYMLFAFFHNVPESGVGNYSASTRRNTPPFLRIPTSADDTRMETLRTDLEATELQRSQLSASILAGTPEWVTRTATTNAHPADSELQVTPEILTLLHKSADDRSDAERTKLNEFRLSQNPAHTTLAKRVAELRNQVQEADLAVPITLVMEEMAEPRPTFVLTRGAYDRKGEQVTANTPAFLPPFPSGAPTNRLGLARWLMDPRNPLTARVAVNRLWQSVFGVGLVRTAEDFGTQGEPPTHPALLDWLAIEFIRTGWDVKHMVKLLVMSRTYRQDSRTTPELGTLDPENRLWARGPRQRLSAEAIRDQALFVSGLLVEMTGGPSVKPYHPPGLYEQVVAGSSASTYVQDSGESLYRRSLYTYWKRSVPNPAMLVFDAPFRETCTARRSRTTTPLQALNLLNDPTYVEAARQLAERMMRDGGGTPESRIRRGFRLATAREPRAAELEVLVGGWRRMVADFSTDHEGAQSLLTYGATPWDPALDPVELAAYATVAATLLNLDETITRQ